MRSVERSRFFASKQHLASAARSPLACGLRGCAERCQGCRAAKDREGEPCCATLGGLLQGDRESHTATLLDDGRVLVVGGRSPEDYEASTELFDPTKPADQAWSVGPPLPVHRWAHAAIKLGNGEVLVTGGYYQSDSAASAWLFDPLAGSWRGLAAVMAEPRRGHAMVLVAGAGGSERVLLVGGVYGSGNWATDTYLNTMEIFDPAKSTFTMLSPRMSKKRSYPHVVTLADGRVLITSGFCGNACENDQQLHDIYDPVLDKITAISHPGEYPYSGMSLALLKDGRAMLISGEFDTRGKAVALNVTTGGTWETLPDLLVPQSRTTATVLKDGTVLVVGGVTSADPYTLADQAERFYP